MASGRTGGDSMKKSSESESFDNQEYTERIKKFLSPLEMRWNYVQSVLLWEKPTHSLCYFIAMTALFGAMASGRFRLVLFLVVIMASSLLLDDVRAKVWQLLQRGGFGAVDDNADSQNTSLSFSRLCERLASIWSCFTAWYEKLKKLKTDNLYKYYSILFGLLLAVVFAYQYLPVMKIFYLTACSLFFWPVIKHHGIHETVKMAVEPFYMPFVVQWKHSRTKRQRDTTPIVALGDGPADSDEEFAEDFQPSADNSAFNRDNTLQDEEFKTLPSFEHPLEVRVLEEIISSAVTQGLSSGVKITNQEVYKDTEIPASTTPDPESPSFDSSAVFLDELQFSSISQAGDTLEFGEGEFMEGLEFPDIDIDSDPELEPSQPVGESQVDNNSKHATTKEGKSKEPRDTVRTQPSRTPYNGVSSSGNTDVSDYEMLDQSEAEGMTPTHETDNVHSTGGLRSVSNYLGKWLGY